MFCWCSVFWVLNGFAKWRSEMQFTVCVSEENTGICDVVLTVVVCSASFLQHAGGASRAAFLGWGGLRRGMSQQNCSN